jgi:hypothetical protein
MVGIMSSCEETGPVASSCKLGRKPIEMQAIGICNECDGYGPNHGACAYGVKYDYLEMKPHWREEVQRKIFAKDSINFSLNQLMFKSLHEE